MNPNDIPRVEDDPVPPSRITLHHLAPITSYDPILQRDARIAGTGNFTPPSILLDFVYGVAAYRRWGSGKEIEKVVQQRFAEHYKLIPIPPRSPPSSDGDNSPEPDDHNDHDYEPGRLSRGRKQRQHMSDGMLQAMDDMLILSMLVRGTNPELMAAERHKREEMEELLAQNASQAKVQEWRESFLGPAITGPPSAETLPSGAGNGESSPLQTD